jgi:hypothetical protein
MTDELVLRLLRRAEGWPTTSPADWAGRLAARASVHRSESFERLAARAVREAEPFAGYRPLVVPARTPVATATWGAGAASVEPDLRPQVVTPAATPPSNRLLLGSSVAPAPAESSSSAARASAAAPEGAALEVEAAASPGEIDAPVVHAEPATDLSTEHPPVVPAVPAVPAVAAAGLSTERPPAPPAARVERAAPPTVQRRAEPAPPAPVSATAAAPSRPLLRVVPTAGGRAASAPAASRTPVAAPRALRSSADPVAGRAPTDRAVRISAPPVPPPLIVVTPSPRTPADDVELTPPAAPAVVAPSAAFERAAVAAAPTELVLAAAPTTVTRTEVAAALESLGRSAEAPSFAAAGAEQPAQPAAEPALDVEGLADRVYGLLVGRIAAERERRGL